MCVLVEAHGGRQTVEDSESKPIVVEGGENECVKGFPYLSVMIALIVEEWMLMWKTVRQSV